MCGIVGAIVTGKQEGLVATVERMTAALSHRGPDDQGISDFELRNSNCDSATGNPQISVVLGARRLAILDLSSAGHQPMRDEEAGLTVAYNGETYNFRELRQEIGGEFGPWRSNTDTEVVLRAYRKWGLSAFEKLRGMFALGIWDARKQELILARDPFGIKPLYYCEEISNFDSRHSELGDNIRNSKSKFLFASEIRALLASGLLPRRLSSEGVAAYLIYGSVTGPATILEGVRSVEPGHYLRVRALDQGFEVEEGSYQKKPIFSSKISESDEILDRDRARTVLRQKLEESVRLHLVSDVPLGVFLSGGMDSSAIVALISQVGGERPKTFSVVFDETEFSEAGHSRLVSQRFQTDHREILFKEDQLIDLLPPALRAMDQPTIDGINAFVVSKAVKEAGVTVALSGLGGDELFAGYPSFRRALRLDSISSFSRRLLSSASRIGRATLGGSVQLNKFWQLAQSDGSPFAAYSISRQLFAPDEVADLLTGQEHGELQKIAMAAANGFSDSRSMINKLRSADVVNAVSQLEMQGYMANMLLRDTDSMSMANSLEVRVPFVDKEVVRFVLGLPGRWKLNGGGPKPLLRDAVSDLLPEPFLRRPKMGFTLPFENWMRLRVRRDLSDVLDDSSRFLPLGLHHESVRGVWKRFLDAPTRVGWSRPWALYVLARWCEFNGVSACEF